MADYVAEKGKHVGRGKLDTWQVEKQYKELDSESEDTEEGTYIGQNKEEEEDKHHKHRLAKWAPSSDDLLGIKRSEESDDNEPEEEEEGEGKEEHEDDEGDETSGFDSEEGFEEITPELMDDPNPIWHCKKPKYLTKSDMRDIVKHTVLHKWKKPNRIKGQVWMLAMDHTPSSAKAFDQIIPQLRPGVDSLIIVHVRVNPFSTRGMLSGKVIREHYKRWAMAVKTLYPCHLKLRDSGINYCILAPMDHDPRKMIVSMSKQHKVDYLVVAIHKRKDRKTKDKYRHVRRMNHYCRRHAACKVILIK